MSRVSEMPYAFVWSKEFPHIAWVDVRDKGLIEEVAVVALDENNGDLYYIPLTTLDQIDRNRLLTIISKRDATKYPLWDLMSSSVLLNGMNALEYFHQLVVGKSVSGQFFKPGRGKTGLSKANLTDRKSVV